MIKNIKVFLVVLFNLFATITFSKDEIGGKIKSNQTVERESNLLLIHLENPIVVGNIKKAYGRIRIFRNSLTGKVEARYLNDNSMPISNGKNGQMGMIKQVKGNYTSVNPKEIKNYMSIYFDNENLFKRAPKIVNLNINKAESFSGMMSTVFENIEGMRVGVDYQGSSRSNYGTDITITPVDRWDLEKKFIALQLRHYRKNELNFTNYIYIKIDAFDGTVYYDSKIEPQLSNNTVFGTFTPDKSGNITLDFNIGTKDYDLRILGKDSEGNVNLSLKIPKQIVLEGVNVIGGRENMLFNVSVEPVEGKGVLTEDTENYYLCAPNDGNEQSNSAIRGRVILSYEEKGRLVPFVRIKGEDLTLVSVGAFKPNGEPKFSKIVDKVDFNLKLSNYEKNDYIETINLSNSMVGTSGKTKKEFDELIKDGNVLVLKNSEGKQIFKTTLGQLKMIKQNIMEAGYTIGYNGKNFEFTKKDTIDCDKNYKIEVREKDGELIDTIDIRLINKNLKKRAEITYDNYQFALVQGNIRKRTETENYGAIRVYAKNDEYQADVGVINRLGRIQGCVLKDLQFCQPQVKGSMIPLTIEKNKGTEVRVTVNNGVPQTKILNGDSPTLLTDGVYSFKYQDGINVYVDFRSGYATLPLENNTRGGIDFLFDNWNGEAKNIEVKVEYSSGEINEYFIKIPEFLPLNYINTGILGDEKTSLNGTTYTKVVRENKNSKLFDMIPVETKDYDLRILGKTRGGISNLKIKIPKKLKLEGIDIDGNVVQDVELDVVLSDIENGKIVKGERNFEDFFEVKPANDGYGVSSKMKFNINLEEEIEASIADNVVKLRGNDVNLLAIGVEGEETSNINKMETVIKNLDYSLIFDTESEVIDFTENQVGDIVTGEIVFTAFDNYDVYVYENDKLFTKRTVKELKKSGITLSEAGIKLKYDETKKQLTFEKIENVNYPTSIGNVLKLEVREPSSWGSEKGYLLKVLRLELKNKLNFELITDNNGLNFGTVFPGSEKTAETFINFINPTKAKIKLEVDNENLDNKMYKDGLVGNDETQIMEFRDIKIEKMGNSEDKVRIRGKLKVPKNIEVGVYRGTLNLKTTIIPR